MRYRSDFRAKRIISMVFICLGALASQFSWADDAQNDKNKKALAANDVASVLAILEVQSPGSGQHILLDVPEIVDKDVNFPVKVKSAIANSDWVALLVDKNSTPLMGQFELAEHGPKSVETRIKLARTSTVIAIVRAGGKYYRVDKEVKVAVPGQSK